MPAKTPTTPLPDEVLKATEILELDKKKREESCSKEIELICEKYRCFLSPDINIAINGRKVGVVVASI